MINLQVIGHLGNDANVNNVNGKTVVNFSVAHSEKWKDAQGNDKDKTTWVSCAYWSEKVNVANYLKKGTQVFVEGIPEAANYQNQQGQTTPQLKLRVRSIQLLSSTKSNQPGSTDTSDQSEKTFVETKDDLPF